MQINKKFMNRAISLAKNGVGSVNPNPLVGAVIVKNGYIIGEGYHEHFGGLHAERNAIKSCSQNPKGADLYVTLEPCSHHGKTPPCTDAILEAGISRVFIGSLDPNPIVSGKGIQKLRQNGVEVITNVLKDECDSINNVFFHYITTKRPFVTMKYAMTADGKIATCRGESKWITGEKARANVHAQRSHNMAILAGIGTVLSDDPMLNCRLEGCRQPIRIVCDSKLRIPLDSNIVKTANKYKTIVATAVNNSIKQKALENAGVEVMYLPNKQAQVDVNTLMNRLGLQGIDSLLIEGGGTLNFEFLRCGIVNRIYAYIAPKIFGGETAKTPVEGKGFSSINDALQFSVKSVSMIDNDILVIMDIASK